MINSTEIVIRSQKELDNAIINAGLKYVGYFGGIAIECLKNASDIEELHKQEIDAPKIVIHSQLELDKLLRQTYNSKLKRCVIDKSLLLEYEECYWGEEDEAFFQYDVECRNIYSRVLGIKSASNIKAHSIIADSIDCINELNARYIFGRYHIKANAIKAWIIQAKNITSDSITYSFLTDSI